MSGVTDMDWPAWHHGYDEPGTPLARRLGAHRFTVTPVPLERGARMFRFTRRPPTLIFIPNGPGACPAALPGLAWAARPAGSLRPVRHPRGDLAA
jgi:hypothetical protein